MCFLFNLYLLSSLNVTTIIHKWYLLNDKWWCFSLNYFPICCHKSRWLYMSLLKGECDVASQFSPDDGDIDFNTGWVMSLKPSTQVKKARDQQTDTWHHCRHEEQLMCLWITRLNGILWKNWRKKRGQRKGGTNTQSWVYIFYSSQTSQMLLLILLCLLQ